MTKYEVGGLTAATVLLAGLAGNAVYQLGFGDPLPPQAWGHFWGE